MERVEISIVQEAFDVLLKNKLKNEALISFCALRNIKIEDLLTDLVKYRKGLLEEKPTEDQMGKFRYLSMKKDRVLLAKTCQKLYQRLLGSEMKTESLAVLAIKFGLSSANNARIYANRYANREFADIGIAPTEEEMQREKEVYESLRKNKNLTNSLTIGKQIFELILKLESYQDGVNFSIERFALAKPTIIFYLNEYIRNTQISEEDIAKYRQIKENNSIKKHDEKRRKTAIKAKEIFKCFEMRNFDFTNYDELIEKYQIKKEQIRSLFNSYINGEYIDVGIFPTDEEINNYNSYKIAKPAIEHNKRIMLGKLAYETLINSNYDKSLLDQICKDNNISISTLLSYMWNYRKRVLEPKPTLEQEQQYLELVQKAAHARTNNESQNENLKKLLIEYIMNNNLFSISQLYPAYGLPQKYLLNKKIESTKDDELIELYHEAKKQEEERLVEFSVIISSLPQPIELLDVQLSTKVSLDVLTHLLHHCVKKGLIPAAITNKITKIIVDSMGLASKLTKERLEKLVYEYKGQKLDDETKEKIYNYLNDLGVKDINRNIMIAFFERMVNNQITIPGYEL